MRHSVLVSVILSFLFLSCKDDDPKPSSRTIKYEVNGNFTGSVFASYTTASGGTTNEQINLPWSKEITYAASVTAAIVALNGNGGVAGQQVTIIVKRGNSQISSTPISVGSTGGFSTTAPAITF
jgi:hypothetical protein